MPIKDTTPIHDLGYKVENISRALHSAGSDIVVYPQIKNSSILQRKLLSHIHADLRKATATVLHLIKKASKP